MSDFRVLGPLSMTIGGRDVTPAAVHQRRMLAVLLMRAGQPVPLAAVIEAIWGDRPPRSAVNSAQSYASRLRAVLGDGTLAWTGTGYRLLVPPQAVDAHRFEALAARARSLDELDRALAEWTDPPYPDLDHYDPAVAQAARLTELWLTARELRADALLELGHTRDAIAALMALTVEFPLREQPWLRLMSALHRAGQQADALAAFRRYDEILAAQGLEPQTPVRDLRSAILATPDAVRGPTPDVIRGPALGKPALGEPVLENPALENPALENPALENPALGEPAASTVPVLVKPAAWPVPAQLPPPTGVFVGRHEELTRLVDLLAAGAGAALVIAAVAGSAGVGKTALAVRWAHRVRDRFPDGQLFADLRGFSAGGPMRPIDALTAFLVALGVAPEQIPVELDQARALYRSLLAGRRVLVMLDNAAAVEQVRPLLPGAPGCFVLITARDRLGGLVARDGAQSFRLGVLSAAEAAELLTGLIGAARVAEDPAAVAELARLCAYVPLALRVAGAALAGQPDWPVRDYLSRLGGDRLSTLVVEDDPESTVGLAFDASYQALPPAAQRMFRLIGLVPGPDISVPAAAALAGLGVGETAALLDRLAAASLLDRPAHDRYSGHDLLRCFAAERCLATDPAAERVAAGTRLAEWYSAGVDAAADLLYPHMLRLPQAAGDRSAAPFVTHAEALAWLDAERRNLVAVVRHDGPPEVRCRLADGLRGYFHLGRHTADWITVAEAALVAAEKIQDPYGEEAARHSLGTAYRSIGDHRCARRQYALALVLARRCGWREAEATMLGNLGIISQWAGRLRAAAAQLTRAVALDRAGGRRSGVANNLSILAGIRLDQGRFAEAGDCYAEALELNRAAGALHGQALALTGLGEVGRALGRPDEAAARLTEALGRYREVGDRDGQAVIHSRLSVVDGDRGLAGSARVHAETALTLAREAGDPRTEADALAALGEVLGREGEHRAAADHYRRAYDLAFESSSTRRRIEVLIGLAGSALRLGDLAEAGRHARSAADSAARSGYRAVAASAAELLDRIEQAARPAARAGRS